MVAGIAAILTARSGGAAIRRLAAWYYWSLAILGRFCDGAVRYALGRRPITCFILGMLSLLAATVARTALRRGAGAIGVRLHIAGMGLVLYSDADCVLCR